MSRYYIFFDVYLQFYDRAPYLGRFKKRDLEKCPEDRNRIRTLEYTHPVLFKIVILLIYNKLLVLLLYKVNIKQTFFYY